MGIVRYQLGEDENEQLNAKLLYVTHSKYEGDWLSLPHTHYFAEIFYVKSGRGEFLVEDRSYPIHTDDFVIINANIPHTEKSFEDESLEYIILGVEGLSFTFQEDREHMIFNCRNLREDFVFYFNTLLREMEKKQRDYELVCQNLLEVLIVHLLRRTGFAFEIAPSEKISRDCFNLKRYIEANYQQDITLDTLAAVAHLNKYYMVHAFTRYFDSSPINYLNEVRIKASKELLTSTDYSIAQVAHSSGFSSQSYFAQVFQKNCGMTATAYRKSCRG